MYDDVAVRRCGGAAVRRVRCGFDGEAKMWRANVLMQ